MNNLKNSRLLGVVASNRDIFLDMLREDYYIHISGYIIQELQLRGYDAMCFGLIESFSQAKMGYFKGGQEEIAYALGVSRKTANEILNRLEEKHLIEKRIVYNETEKKKETVIMSKVTKGYNTKVTILPDQSNDSLQTYNKESNNINNNPPLYPPKGETQPKKEIVNPLPLPHKSERFSEAWGELLQMPKWRHKTARALKMALKQLGQVSERDAISAIEQAISGEYQGLHPKNLHPDLPKEKHINIEDLMGYGKGKN